MEKEKLRRNGKRGEKERQGEQRIEGEKREIERKERWEENGREEMNERRQTDNESIHREAERSKMKDVGRETTRENGGERERDRGAGGIK